MVLNVFMLNIFSSGMLTTYFCKYHGFGLITTQHKHKNKYTTTNTQLQIHNNKHTQLQIHHNKYATTNTPQQIHDNKYTYKNHNYGFAREHRQLWEAHQSGRVCARKAPTRFSIDLLNSWILTELETKRTSTSYPVYTKCRDVWVGLAK